MQQPLRIMRNDGGSGRVAKTTAVKTLDSGPMGGLSSAAALSRLNGIAQMVTVDVGGTSTDIGLVENQRPVVNLFGSVHDLPLSFSFPRQSGARQPLPVRRIGRFCSASSLLVSRWCRRGTSSPA